MPRQGRINIEGGIYHVIQRGIERRGIFRDNDDRKEFLRRLAEGLGITGQKCYGWVLMPNHFHLIIRTGAKPLSDLMRKLSTGYALYFNKKYKRSGYLFQGRYKSILCEEDNYLMELVRYIHLNPMRAGLVEDMTGLNEYKWSGHSVLMGNNKADWQSAGEILERFGVKKSEAVRQYAEFVKEAKGAGKRADLTGGGLIRSAGEWKEVLYMSRDKEKQLADERILGDGDFVEAALKEAEEKMQRRDRLKKEGWTEEKLVEEVIKHYHIEKQELSRKGRMNKISKAKSVITYYAAKYLGLRNREIAELFECGRSAISRMIFEGEKISNNEPVKWLINLRP